MANNALFDEVMEYIEAHNELWNQGAWFKLYVNGFSLEEIQDMLNHDPDKPPCGAAGCFAGNTILLEGWVPVFKKGYSDEQYWYADDCRPVGDDEGVRVGISGKAAELLDIDHSTAEELFSEFNTLEDLREMVAHIKEHGDLESYGDETTSEDLCDPDSGCEVCYPDDEEQ